MTYVKKESHQKRRLVCSRYNRDNVFIDIQPTFEEALVVDSSTKTLIHLIDMDKDDDDKVDNDSDADDDSKYILHAASVLFPASISLDHGNHDPCCSSLHPEHQVRNYSL